MALNPKKMMSLKEALAESPFPADDKDNTTRWRIWRDNPGDAAAAAACSPSIKRQTMRQWRLNHGIPTNPREASARKPGRPKGSKNKSSRARVRPAKSRRSAVKAKRNAKGKRPSAFNARQHEAQRKAKAKLAASK